MTAAASSSHYLHRDQLTATYRLWLKSKNYSSSTIRNYVVDLNKYLLATPADQYLDYSSIEKYITAITGQNNDSRQLASLNKFCQFAIDQNLIDHNPLDQSHHKSPQNTGSISLDNLVSDFAKYLESHHKTPATIKNYLNDITQFITWANSESK